VGDGVNDLQFDQFVGQQPHRPVGPPCRRRRASHGNQPGLGCSVELAWAAGPVLRFAGQGSVQPLLDQALAHAGDSGQANVQGLGDLRIGPSGAAGGRIGLEQDAGMGKLLSGCFASGDQVVQELALFVGQGHNILLHRGSSQENPQ
jgi:hypothetical protein